MQKPENRKPKTKYRPLSPSLRGRLKRLAAEKGTNAAAALIGVHPQTYANVAAGLPAHRSTAALVERRLAEIDDGGAP